MKTWRGVVAWVLIAFAGIHVAWGLATVLEMVGPPLLAWSAGYLPMQIMLALALSGAAGVVSVVAMGLAVWVILWALRLLEYKKG